MIVHVFGNVNCFEFDNAVEDKTFAKHSIFKELTEGKF